MRRVALRILACGYMHDEKSKQVVLDNLDSDTALPVMKEVLEDTISRRNLLSSTNGDDTDVNIYLILS